MKVLELFKGTGSVGKAILRRYPDAQIISVDIEAKYKPTIVGDVMDLDYKQWQPNSFDLIWASPPCNNYSKMQDIMGKMTPEKLAQSDRVVQRALDIINYLQPKYWFMENPQTGKLKSREVVKGIPFVDADYCRYGYPYKKRTRFWGTVKGIEMKKCSKKTPCASLVIPDKGRCHHQTTIGLKTSGGGLKYKSTKLTLEDRYSIPQLLLDDLFCELCSN